MLLLSSISPELSTSSGQAGREGQAQLLILHTFNTQSIHFSPPPAALLPPGPFLRAEPRCRPLFPAGARRCTRRGHGGPGAERVGAGGVPGPAGASAHRGAAGAHRHRHQPPGAPGEPPRCAGSAGTAGPGRSERGRALRSHPGAGGCGSPRGLGLAGLGVAAGSVLLHGPAAPGVAARSLGVFRPRRLRWRRAGSKPSAP